MDTEKLNAALEWLLETVQSSEAFVLDQAPSVAQEIIMWERVSAGGLALFFFLFTIIGSISSYKLIKYADKLDADNKYNDTGAIFPGITGIILGVFSAFSVAPTLVNTHNFLYAMVAPKLVIIDYITNLL